MKRTLSLLTVLLAPSFAIAQPAQPSSTPPALSQPAPDGVPLQQFLERRVVEELAAEGTVLGRLGYSIRVQLTGNLAEISLVDTTSGRMVRATKIDNLADNRDAALATVTQVAANLVAQQAQLATTPAQVAPVSVPAVAPPGAAIMSREEAEARFAREAIGFGVITTIVVTNYHADFAASSTRKWQPWQGELRSPLSYGQFYELVNRPDLKAAHRARRQTGGLLMGGAIVGIVASTLLFDYALSQDNYDLETGESSGSSASWMVLSGALTLASCAAMYGGYYLYGSQPVTEAEAKSLAQKYNDGLRRKYGLPVAASPRTLRPDFRLTGIGPYVAENQAGLAARLTF